jgi:alkaline phosphatase
MHVQDVDRALGDLLELDDTIRATVAHLEKLGLLEETLILVTADHGHGFDVYGSSDTEYLNAQDNDRAKRGAVGVYAESGLSAYTVPNNTNPTTHEIFDSPQGEGFPVTWDPRYTIAHGYAAFPDKREDFAINDHHERIPSVKNESGYFFNPQDNPKGFAMTGNLDVSQGQGVHSLVDVPIYSWGPGHECFRGVMGNIDIAFNLAKVMGLGQCSNITAEYKP